MAASWKKFTALGLLVVAIFLYLHGSPQADKKIDGEPGTNPRVVILAPAAADVVERLGAGAYVVGVTNSVDSFPSAAKVGTHLNPGVEKIASLKPDLIVATSRFNPELAERMGAGIFVYEPKTMEGIIENIRLLADKIGKKEQGHILAGELQVTLDGLIQPQRKPAVLYETRSTPLAIAKDDTVIKDLLERSGMIYAYPENTGSLSAEYLLANQPEYYIYQDGPMNKNPVPPVERPGWENFKACYWKVNEFDFARPNTKIFETARILNGIINSDSPCVKGAELYQ